MHVHSEPQQGRSIPGCRPASDADVVDGVRARWVAEPADDIRLTRGLADAASQGLAVVPRGGGTKLDWGDAPAAVDVIFSTRRLDRVIEHAAGDMTVTVQAGCTIAALQQTLARGRQRLALDPLWPDRATVGGVLATNDSGALRAAYGSLRDLVIGITVALPDGTLARSGGKVVKNVAGYDLPKLMVGALGTLGVITEATFRLHPLPAASRAFAFTAPAARAMNALVLAIHDSPLTVTGLQVHASRRLTPTVSLRLEGSQASLDAEAARVTDIARSCGATPAEVPSEARESLWDGPDPAAVCKVTALPARLANLCAAFDAAAPDWRAVLQGAGVGLVRITPPEAAGPLRKEAERLGGSLVVLRCPADVKQRIGTWGDLGGARRLMQQVRTQFDPNSILNPGRFI